MKATTGIEAGMGIEDATGASVFLSPLLLAIMGLHQGRSGLVLSISIRAN